MLISQASNTEMDYISDGAKISSLIWRALQDQTIAVHVVGKKAYFCVLVIPQVHFSTSKHIQGEFWGHKTAPMLLIGLGSSSMFCCLCSSPRELGSWRVCMRTQWCFSHCRIFFSHCRIFIYLFSNTITIFSLQSSYLLYKNLRVICKRFGICPVFVASTCMLLSTVD